MATTRKELSDRWGVTPQAISKFRQAGMPMDSVEAAESWRAKYTRVRHRKSKTKAKITIDIEKDALTRPLIDEGGYVDQESARANLETLTATAQQCREAIAAAITDGDQEVARRWVTSLTSVMRANAQTARQLQEVLLADKELMRRDEVEEVYIGNLREMRALTEAAIDALPGQLNPADPAHAREVFSDWFENTYLFSMFNLCARAKIPREQWPEAAIREVEGRPPMPPAPEAGEAKGLAPDDPPG
jgi:hypothetical protein